MHASYIHTYIYTLHILCIDNLSWDTELTAASAAAAFAARSAWRSRNALMARWQLVPGCPRPPALSCRQNTLKPAGSLPEASGLGRCTPADEKGRRGLLRYQTCQGSLVRTARSPPMSAHPGHTQRHVRAHTRAHVAAHLPSAR